MTYQPTGPLGAQPTGPLPTRPQRSRRALTYGLAGTIAVLVTVIAVVAAMTLTGRDSSDDLPEITLQSVGTVSDGPFTPTVALVGEVVAPTKVGNVNDRGVRGVSGTAAGLYGTTGSAACNSQMLSDYLRNDSQAAAAWSGALGVTSNQIPYYINTLTPVVLRTDAWVTNNVYRNGKAQPYQSVLQAGTPVLVDRAGVPRVQCASGSPLGPPARAPLSGYQCRGSVWQGYQPRDVTAVHYRTSRKPAQRNGRPNATDNRDENYDDENYDDEEGYDDEDYDDVDYDEEGYDDGDGYDDGAPTIVVVLNLVDVHTGALRPQRVGGDVSLAGLPPMEGKLPNPRRANAPFVPRSEEAARDNGLEREGSDQAAPKVKARKDVPAENPAESSTSAPDRDRRGGPASDTTAPAESGTTATTTPSEPNSRQRSRGGATDDSTNPSNSVTSTTPETSTPTTETTTPSAGATPPAGTPPADTTTPTAPAYTPPPTTTATPDYTPPPAYTPPTTTAPPAYTPPTTTAPPAYTPPPVTTQEAPPVTTTTPETPALRVVPTV